MFCDYAKSIADGAAKYMPLATPIVATIGACIAYFAIRAQKAIARKRAAIDFFLKTETDSYMLTAWHGFEAARKEVSESPNLAEFETAKAKHWLELRNYLNLHELLAVGIKQQVLDNSVCFDFWNGELHRAYRDCAKAIEFIQTKPGEARTYCELVKLHERWSKMRSAGGL